MRSSLARVVAAALSPAALLFFAWASAGCGPDVLAPAFEIEGRRMVWVPFRGPDGPPYYSKRGNRLTRGAIDTLLRAGEENDSDVLEVVPFEDVVEAVAKEDPLSIKNEALAKRVKADLFLEGTITRWETRRSGDVALLRGRATIRVIVRETEKPRGHPLLDRKLEVVFPKARGYTSWGGLATSEATEADVDQGLLSAAVRDLVDLFRYHEVEEP